MTNDPLVGRDLDGYRLESLIGRGGMGAVYLARSERQDRPVAVKVMLPELSGNADFRQRFMREAASALDHPNIVPILGTGEVDDVLYIAMEFIRGSDLKKVIGAEGRLSPRRCVQILTQSAGALDHAHENGIVHRDVKPQNVLLQQDGSAGEDHAYLSDFGLVKKIASESSFTASVYLMGTLHYMAPEQIEGKAIDGRTDVYALGCVAFEALTGRVPFDHETEVAVLWAQVNEEPPSAVALQPVLPDAVDVILAKALAKSPDDRFLTAGEFASALALELGDASSRSRSVWGPNQISASGKRSRPLKKELAARAAASKAHPQPKALGAKGFLVGIAAASLLFGWIGFSDPDRREAIGDFMQEVAPQPFTNADSPKSGEEGRSDPRARATGTSAASEGRRSRGNSSSVPSGASDTFAPSASSDPSGLDLDVPAALPKTPARSGDGTLRGLVFAREHERQGGSSALFAMQPGGGHVRMILNSGNDDYDPVWSPDGRQLAWASGFWIYVMNADGSSVRRVSPNDGWARYPTWSPDGDRLAFSYSPTARQTLDRTRGWGIVSVRVATPSSITAITPVTGADHDPTWSPNGDEIAFTSMRDDEDGDIAVIGTSGTGLRVIAEGAGAQRQPTWSPSGDVVAYSGQDGSGSFSIYTWAANGVTRRITTIARAFAPEFSPNGKRIAFVGMSKEDSEGLSYMLASRTGERIRRLARADHWSNTPDWR